jgi:hypothetical protein
MLERPIRNGPLDHGTEALPWSGHFICYKCPDELVHPLVAYMERDVLKTPVAGAVYRFQSHQNV